MSGKRRAAGPPVKKAPSGPARGRSGKPGSPKPTPRQRWKRVAIWAGIGFLSLLLLAVGSFFVLYTAIDIPDPNEDFETQTSFVYYSDGETELGRYATQNRESITYDEMPETLKDAVVAIENQSFWTDRGVDPKGILRAVFNNASSEDTQGASTITQQYVKILYLNQERSYTRKVKEAILALKLQRKVSKKEILTGYLNTIYFGRGAYGVEAAAKAYFQVPAADLDLRQSAALAAILNSPSRFDPANGKASLRALRARYQQVLSNMVELENIPAAEGERAAKRLPAFPPEEAESAYADQKGHMLTMVREELERLGFPEEEINGGGLRVTTTFTEKGMTAAKDGVVEQRPEGFKDKQLHVGAAIVEPGTGAVVGFYAGQDYLDSQLNWAVEGGQAGSTFKAFALAAAIEDGFSLNDTFDGNSPIVLPDGLDFENQGFTDYGSSISMVSAAENSVNTAFIDMTISMENGPDKIVDMAEAMGIPGPRPDKQVHGFPQISAGLLPQTGVALGSATVSPINMANGYATIANKGVAAQPFIIKKVVDAEGKVRFNHKVSTRRAVSEDIAADVSYALQQVVSSGSGTAALELGRPAAGKTGTATNGKGEVSSAWFAGFTPQLATAVMYVRGQGNEQLEGWLPSYFGGAFPAETWTAIMGTMMDGLPVEEFPEPVFVDGDAPTDGHEPYVRRRLRPGRSRTPASRPRSRPRPRRRSPRSSRRPRSRPSSRPRSRPRRAGCSAAVSPRRRPRSRPRSPRRHESPSPTADQSADGAALRGSLRQQVVPRVLVTR